VDPDNRHPVDHARRAAMLTELLAHWQHDPAAALARAATQWQDGGIKLLMTALLLRLRARDDSLQTGDYLPCDVQSSAFTGAFLRRGSSSAVLVVFRRFPFAASTATGADSTRVALPTELSAWRDVLRGQPANPQEALNLGSEMPVAVFLSEVKNP
jgi:(1->4)-alpha-D-glucan 1-alpha-D-glucosylmutase